MGESAGNFSVLYLHRGLTLLSPCDKRGEIFLSVGADIDMMRARHADYARRIHTVEIRTVFARRHDTVRSEQEHTVELLKLVGLLPPGVAVVAGEVWIFLERGIILSREHFRVGVDVDTLVLALFEQLFEVFEIVAADEDTGTVAHAYVHFGDFRVAVASGIGFVEKRHSAYAAVSHVKHELCEFVGSQIMACRLGHRMLDYGIDIIVLVAEIGGMPGIGGHTFAAVYGQLLQSAYVIVGLGEHSGHRLIFFGFVGCGAEFYRGEVGQGDAVGFRRRKKSILDFKRMPDISVERVIVKIGVGDGGEQRVNDFMTRFARCHALFAQRTVYRRDAAYGIKQQVHSCRCVGMFTAYAYLFASFTTRRLLALVAKHIGSAIHNNSLF